MRRRGHGCRIRRSAIRAWRGERANLAEMLMSDVRPGDVVITMGAGDITRTGRELLAGLRKKA